MAGTCAQAEAPQAGQAPFSAPPRWFLEQQSKVRRGVPTSGTGEYPAFFAPDTGISACSGSKDYGMLLFISVAH